MSKLPYDLENLVGGPLRALYAPIETALPAKPVDVFAQTAADEYEPAGAGLTWKDFGATSGSAPQVSRNFEIAGAKVHQSRAEVLKRVTAVTRQVQIPFAELSPEILQIVENAPAVATIAAAANSGAAKKVAFGNVTDLTPFRLALFAELLQDQGVVTEPGGVKRGRWFGYVAYKARLSADNVQLQFEDNGTLAVAQCTFELEPDPTATEGQEHGFWVIEDAGTILAA